MNEGRLGVEKHWTNLRYSVEPKLARELARLDDYIRLDSAHVVMLTETGIIDIEAARALLAALRGLSVEPISEGELDPQRGSLLAQIEHRLSRSAGTAFAHMMHIGRSRNDQHEAVYRLGIRDRLLGVVERTLDLTERMLATAREHRDAWMPAYTHLQPAMPTTLGHYWLRHCYVLLRDLERERELYQRTDLSALGGAALVGTTWPIDRRRVAVLLGHPDIVRHSTDAGIFGRDLPAELAAVLSILVNDVARPIGDLYVWASREFGYVELADELCDTSSIMPQKKNPEALERIRGIGGMATGWLTGVLAVQRSASSTDMDLVYGLDPTFGYLDETVAALDLAAVSVETTRYRLDRMADAANDRELMATNLADRLVQLRGVPFRDAHQIVGRVVRLLHSSGGDQRLLRGELIDTAARDLDKEPLGLTDKEVEEVFDLDAYRRAMRSEGGMGSASVEQMCDDVGERVSECRAWLDERRRIITEADRLREQAIDDLLTSAAVATAKAGRLV